MMVPLTPGLGKLRIASPADILRLGIVCTAGFWYSEHFHWVRPYHAQYPLDTITFFQHEVAGLLENPEFIVLAAVDAYDPQESEKTEATIPAGHGWQIPEAGEEVVVGLAVWKLEPNSKRYGQYRNDTGSFPELPEYLHRDESKERIAKTDKVVEEAELKHFQGLSAMERTVIHPAYWRRGHGSKLTKWGTDFADIDGVDQGVSATSMGAILFRHMGFQNITTVNNDGDEEDPRGLSFDLLKYVSNQKGADENQITL